MNINLLLIIVIVIMLAKIVDGYKKGMVREVISFLSLIVMCITAVLIGNGLNNYYDRKFVNVAVMVLLLCLVGIANHMIHLALLPAKIISKLPVVHWLDKLLGAVAGALETVLFLWTVYTFIMMMDMGAIGDWIITYTQKSDILIWFYQHNYLATWVEQLSSTVEFLQYTDILDLPVLGKEGKG